MSGPLRVERQEIPLLRRRQPHSLLAPGEKFLACGGCGQPCICPRGVTRTMVEAGASVCAICALRRLRAGGQVDKKPGG